MRIPCGARLGRVLCVVLALATLSAGTALAGEAPAATRELVHKLIEAHGGMEKWAAAPTVSLEHKLVAPQQPDDPWISYDTTEQGLRRTYQDWTHDEAEIVYDGSKTWSVGWKRLNPPKFMVNMAYYFVCMPWILEDDGVILSEPGTGKLPDDDTEYKTITMTFEAGVGETPDDKYIVFIDPKTHLMKATRYWVTYGAMLDLMNMPPEVKALGPITHVYDEFQTVEGLTVPATYHTIGPAGRVMGEHWVTRVSFSEKFDESRMEMPHNAEVDKSSVERKARMDM